MLFLQFRFDIYSTLMKKTTTYDDVVWFVHILDWSKQQSLEALVTEYRDG